MQSSGSKHPHDVDDSKCVKRTKIESASIDTPVAIEGPTAATLAETNTSRAAGAVVPTAALLNAQPNINRADAQSVAMPATSESNDAKSTKDIKLSEQDMKKLTKKRAKSDVAFLFGRIFARSECYDSPTVIQVIGYTKKKVICAGVNKEALVITHYPHGTGGCAVFDPTKLAPCTDEDELIEYKGKEYRDMQYSVNIDEETLDKKYQISLRRKGHSYFETTGPANWTWVDY